MYRGKKDDPLIVKLYIYTSLYRRPMANKKFSMPAQLLCSNNIYKLFFFSSRSRESHQTSFITFSRSNLIIYLVSFSLHCSDYTTIYYIQFALLTHRATD